MASCYCGNSYVKSYHSNTGYNVDMCPACISASTPESYVTSKEWIQGHVSENTEYNPEANDN